MTFRLLLGACLAGALLSAARGENLLYNSGFQLGTADYACVRYMKPSGEAPFLPPAPEAGAPAEGTAALRFDNPRDDGIVFQTHEFAVVPGSPYAVSLWMKSDRPDLAVRLHFVSIARDGRKTDWDNTQFAAFHVGSEWKRYVFPVTTRAGHAYYYAELLWGGTEGGGPGATLWIDAPQVNAGKEPLPYQPAAEIEAAFTATANLAVDGQAPPEFAFAAVNHGARPARVDAALRAADTFFGTVRDLPPVALDLPPGQTARAKLAPPLGAKGGFRLDGSWRSGTAAGDVPFPLHYAVSVEAHAPAPDLGRDFCAGIDDDLGLVPGTYDNPYPVAFHGLGWSEEERFRFLEQEGVRLLRAGNNLVSPALSWASIEPRDGEFDWALGDALVDLAAKHRIRVMPVLGDVFCYLPPPAARNRLPDWLIAKGRPFAGMPSAEKRRAWTLPPLDDWSRYISAVVSHFKGRITHYEILNEPNLWLPAEEYARYLKAAYEAAKQADPGCTIVAFCSTGDLDGNMKGFLQKCGELGAFRYADAVSFHPYDARNDDTPIRAADQIGALRKLVDAYKPGIPLWNTELYYLDNGDDDFTPVLPDAFARRTLIDLGEGVSQSVTVAANAQLVNDLQPHYGFLPSVVVHAPIPSDLYPATAALADFVGGARPAGEVHWADNLLCYVYAGRAGQPVAACWARSERDRATVTLPPGIQAFDLFGNPLPDGATMLGRAPLYLTAKLAPDAFRKALEAVPVTPEYPCAVLGARFSGTAAAHSVAVEVRNNTDQPQTPQVRLDDSPVGPSPQPVSLSLAPRETRTLFFPVPSPSGACPYGKASVSLATGPKSVTTPLRLRWMSYAVPGQRWRVDAAGRVVVGADRWGGATDSSFSFYATVTPEALSIHVQVREAKRSPRPADAAAWDGDAVEFFVDPQPDHALDHPDYLPDTVHAVIVPRSIDGAGSRLAWMTSPLPAARWECRDVPDGGYEAVLTLPWAALGHPGPGALGLDVAVDSSDGVHRRCQIAWAGSGSGYRNRFETGRLEEAPK